MLMDITKTGTRVLAYSVTWQVASATYCAPTQQETREVPTYMDIHDLPGVKAEDVAGAHAADVRVQVDYGVDYKQYWVDEESGKVFCLVDAPDRETATRVHREAHGLEAHTLYKVEPGV
jgi:Nickel responsive protein SCO4226-like